MRLDELLLTILGVTILINVLLIVASWLHARGLRASGWPEPAGGGAAVGGRTGAAPPSKGEPTGQPLLPFGRADQDDDERVAAAVEAFVAGVSPDAAGSARVPTAAEVLAQRREALGSGPATVDHAGPARAEPVHPERGAPARLAGLVDGQAWDGMVREESARAARFGRPSMVVTVSLPQLENVAERWGRAAADRVMAETARLLESEGRAVDRIARLGHATFGILLPETGEPGASRYAERVRAAADAWLSSAGLSVRLELGWTSLPNGTDVDSRSRMHDVGGLSDNLSGGAPAQV